MTASPAIARSPRSVRVRAVAIWGLVVAEIAWLLGDLVLLPEPAELPRAAQGIFILLVASFGLVGALVASRRQGNAIGWLMWSVGLGLGALTGASSYVYQSVAVFGGSLPGTVAIAWVSTIGAIPAFAGGFLFVPLLFPNGRPLTPRWRWVLAFALVTLTFATLPELLTPGPLASYPGITNPVPVPAILDIGWLTSLANGPAFLVAALLTVVSCVLRYRRGAGVERQQLKWLAAATIVTLACFLLAASGIPVVTDVGWIAGIITLNLIPVAVGVAILRYRLYEIDTLINRALVYGLLTAILAGLFAAASSVLQGVFAGLLGPGSQGSSIASTIIVVAAFEPVKRRVQALVDRRFRGVRDPAIALGALVADVRASLVPCDPARTLRRFADLALDAFQATAVELTWTVGGRAAPAIVVRRQPEAAAGVGAGELSARATSGVLTATVTVSGVTASRDSEALAPALEALLAELQPTPAVRRRWQVRRPRAPRQLS
jgi:hypothetical protein